MTKKIVMFETDIGPEEHIGFLAEQVSEQRQRADSAVQRNAELEQIAYTDELTGLLNRRGLNRAIQLAMEQARKQGTPIGLLNIDLDRFKAVNDELGGHKAGDKVLERVAGVMQKTFRFSDLLNPDFASHDKTPKDIAAATGARPGGDEFHVLLDLTPRDYSEGMVLDRETVTASLGIAASRLATNFDTEFSKDEDLVSVGFGASIGQAVWMPASGISAEDFLAESDLAMYAQKQGEQR